MATLPSVPGVYFEPQPRAPEVPFVRTDVVGFIGFESRIRNGSQVSRIIDPSVPQGHEFNIDVSNFNLDVGRERAEVPGITNLSLSADPAAIPIADGQSIVYALNAVLTGSGQTRLVAVAGAAAATGVQRTPSEADIASYIPAVRDGTLTSTLTGGTPPVGHVFRIDVLPFDIRIGESHLRIPANTNLVISESATSIPILDGETIVYAITIAEVAASPRFVVVPGTPATSGSEKLPTDSEIRDLVLTSLGNRRWERIANVRISRVGNDINLAVDDFPWTRLANIHIKRQGTAINLTVIPTLPPAQLDDWNDYIYSFGVPQKDGTYLSPAIRAYFANGGRRCYVTTVRRPDFEDTAGLESARGDLVGSRGDGIQNATGLERLLLIPDVSIVDVPDLYALREVLMEDSFELPGTTEQACFIDCQDFTVVDVQGIATLNIGSAEPLYTDNQVLNTQLQMLNRVIDERWRVLLLFTIPVELNPVSGQFEGPTKEKAQQWQKDLTAAGETPEKMSCAAIYFPWLLYQKRVDALAYEMPPTPFVAGVIARRDLARGPHISPANETLRGVVGTSQPINDEVNGELYEPPSSINVLRTFPGYGIQVWGARTLSTDTWLRYVSVRRCLSAIERRALAALQPLIFEPNNAGLWLQITQMLLSVLLPIYESGALRGNRPEEAFYIRCDSSTNPPEQIENGILVCEVGVAVAAPAEFIVFRLGRREGAVEVIE